LVDDIKDLYRGYGGDKMQMYIELFGKKIPGYGFFIAIGFSIIILYLRYQTYYKDMDFDTGLIALVCALVSGGVGAKVLYWITDPKSFLILFNTDLGFVDRLEYGFAGGLVFLGGLIGAGIGILIFLKIYRNMDPLMVLDLFSISLPILHMFGRLGCFMAGCCYGRETTCSIGISYPQGGLAPYGMKLFPTQLFGAVGNLLIVLLLIALSRKKKKPGRLFALYLILYSIGRFIIEFFRGDEVRGIYYFFSTSQWLSIPIFIVGIIMFFISKEVRSKDKSNA